MHIKISPIFFLLLIVCNLSALSQNGDNKKVALVIGVKNYDHVSPLQNTLNDARDMAATLKEKGFKVIEVYDPRTKRQLQEAVITYFELLRAGKQSSGLLFYSGHGMQVDGINYLIPTTADLKIKADIEDQCLSMNYVMSAIEDAGNPLNIFILDACRNNPFKSFYRSTEKGLSLVSSPVGSYIVYATKPGSVASDGTGRNGLFTSKLLGAMNKPGLNIEQVFKRVAAEVANESGDAQRPWIASDYTGDFYFTPAADISSGNAPVQKMSALSVIVNEEFSQNKLRWFEEENEKFSFKISDGKYKIESKQGGSWWSSLPFQFDTQKDYEISTTIKKISGTDDYYFGIVLGLDPLTKYYHFAGWTAAGNYTFANKGTVNKDVITGFNTNAVQTGNSTNYLLLKKTGNTIKLFLNGQLMGETTNEYFYGDLFGFQLWSGNNKLAIEVDQFTIKSTN